MAMVQSPLFWVKQRSSAAQGIEAVTEGTRHVTRHILVATDGSDTAQKAVTLAAELAAKFDVPLTVGHVLQYGRHADGDGAHGRGWNTSSMR